MDAGENGNNSRALGKLDQAAAEKSDEDPQSVYGTAAGCNQNQNTLAVGANMIGLYIKDLEGTLPAMKDYGLLTLVAISVLAFSTLRSSGFRNG